MFKKLIRKKTINQILSEAESSEKENSLNRTLTVRDLTAFGIAAIVGAGIFSTIGTASANGGPAVVFLFIFIAIACAFSALSYAEFASMVPVSGSAYTYTYISFGELAAWIIGWALLFEYAIGNVAVAISWSDYFTGFLSGLGIHIPSHLSMDYFSAYNGFNAVIAALSNGELFSSLPAAMQEKYFAWMDAPTLFGIKFIVDIPVLIIITFITYLVYVGIKETRTASNIMVAIKLMVVLAVITIGFFYVNPANWDPFAPNGITGVLKGVSAVFFAYIGFDAISTTAEECKNPQRDLPRGMFYSLIICTVLYVLIALVLTGLVPYYELAVGDPLAFVFKRIGMDWFSGIIAFSAVIAISSVLLVFQLGQPRIWMSMSRDGLLPKAFSRIHKKFKTPSFATIVTGFVVAIPALFMNLIEVADLTSMKNLFAFVLVNAGVLMIQNDKNMPKRKFKIPYINGKYIISILVVITIALANYFAHDNLIAFFDFSQEGFEHKIPYLVFIILTGLIMFLSYSKNLSLIPTLGLLSCLYLMTELGIKNWIGFSIWLLIGLGIYFSYGYRHSKLNIKSS